MIIRLGIPSDIPHLASIERAAELLFPDGLLPQQNQVQSQLALQTAEAANLLFVAEVDRAVVGFAVTRRLGAYLHLDEMSVHPDFGRRGIGRSLVSTVKKRAHQRGLPGVTLTTFDHIAWNRPFYESCGFMKLADTQLTSELEQLLHQELLDGFTHRVAMRSDTI
jgi:predicted N-acetyltransferase YhbS